MFENTSFENLVYSNSLRISYRCTTDLIGQVFKLAIHYEQEAFY